LGQNPTNYWNYGTLVVLGEASEPQGWGVVLGEAKDLWDSLQLRFFAGAQNGSRVDL